MIAWLAGTALAGAWTRDAGELYTKVGADLYRPSTFVMPGDDEVSPGTYLGQQYGLYAEAGVSRGHPVQLSLAVPLVVGTVNTVYVDRQGEVPLRATTVRPGDLRVAAQVALHPTAPIAAAVELKLPLYANGAVGADYPTFAELFPKPGDGQIDVTGWLSAGFTPIKGGFVEVGIGWRHRTEVFVGWLTPIRFVDGGVFAAKIGRRFGPVLPIVGVEGLVNPVPDALTRQYATVWGTALVDITEGWAVEPRVSADLWAENTSRGFGGGMGLSYRR